MKDYWSDEKSIKKLNKKKLSITIYIFLIIIVLAILFSLYLSSQSFRNWVDKNILKKEITQNDVATIDLNSEDNYQIYAYDKYIAILNNNVLNIYNSSGKEEKKLDIEINNAIFKANNKFLVIAEENGQKLYLISKTEILWTSQVDGNISQINVNKNGYVTVVMTDTIHKSVINIYTPNSNGKELFKAFLSSTRVVDTSISNDNKYLAIAEIDTSGTSIQSSVTIISMEKAQKEELKKSVTYTHNAEPNKLITNIKYQDKNNLICMYNDTIDIISNEQSQLLVNSKDKKITFMSAKLENNIVIIEEKSSGLFTSDSVVQIINTSNKKESIYTVKEIAKEIMTYNNIITLNFGTEIHFINTNGWLIKKYIAEQEITNVVLSDNVAGIIYRDRVEIINL